MESDIAASAGGPVEAFFEQVERLVRRIRESQMDAIRKAAGMIADSVAVGHPVHIFGSGHSHMIAEEMCLRAGGLIVMSPVLDIAYMPYGGARMSSDVERLPGYASIVLNNHGVRPGEILIVVSNSGKNQGPVEMAIYAKEMGMQIIALTSLEHSRAVKADHPSGKKLFEVADLVLDSCVPVGDACLEISPELPKVAPLSTIACATVMEAIVAEVASELWRRGLTPPVAISANVPGGDEHNRKLEELYGEAVKRVKWY